MASSDEDIFASKPFTFIVQGKPLHVHAALVSNCSAPLDRMINGHLSEAQQGFARIDDFTEATFARFIRWMYSKDYPAPDHITMMPETEAEPSIKKEISAELDECDLWSTAKKEKKKKKKLSPQKGSLKETFISHQYQDAFDSCPAPALRSNQSSQEDYSEVFLSHAQLYVFAEKYDVQLLKKLTLQKLQQTLAIFTLYPSRVEDILSLVKYVYSETMPSQRGFEDIRTMLMHYIGSEMETLERHGGIKDLFAGNQEMLDDFLVMFAQRIS